MLLRGLLCGDLDVADAVTVDGRVMSGPDLLGAAGALAARLDGNPVAVTATPSLETVVTVTGGLLAGVTVVPVPPDAGPRERTHILRDAGAEELDFAVDLRARAPLPTGPARLAGPALVLYTSGSTGPPKGVPLTGEALMAGLDGLADAWDWNPQDTLVHGLPLFHVHGLVLGVLGALRVGSRLVHTGRPTPPAYAAAAGTLYFGVPTVWSRVCAEPAAARALGGARLLVSGSAALPLPVFRRLTEATGRPPVERYGMTETLITCSTRADGERRAGSVGLPLRGTSTRVIAEDGTEVPRDGETPGDLLVRGPTVFAGYLGDPAASTGMFDAEGWMRTGDMASLDPDGFHRIVGRRSTDLIKSGGYRIGAGEVESALLAHPGVREAAVVGEPDDDLGQRVVAYVVGDATAQQLTDFVAAELAVHKRPRRVVVVTELPRTALGKVRKDLLGRHLD
jgi:fatty acid CoA ligase FadD36